MKALKSPILWIVLAISIVVTHRLLTSSNSDLVGQIPLIPSSGTQEPTDAPAAPEDANAPSATLAEEPASQKKASTCEIGKCEDGTARRAPLDRKAATKIWQGETFIEISSSSSEHCWSIGETYMLDEAGPGESRLFRAIGKLTGFKKTASGIDLSFLILNASPTESELLSPVCGSFCDQVTTDYPPADAQNAVLILGETPQAAAQQVSNGLFSVSGPQQNWPTTVPWPQLASYKNKKLFVVTNIPVQRTGGIVAVMAEAKKNGFQNVTWVYPLSSTPDLAALNQPHFANGVTLLSPAQLSEIETSNWVLLVTNDEAKPKDWKGKSFVFPEPLSVGMQLSAQERESLSVRLTPVFKLLKKEVGDRNVLVMGRGILDTRPRALSELLVLAGFPNVYAYTSSGANWTKSPP